MSSTTDDVVVRLRLRDVGRFIRDVRSGRLSIEDLERRLQRMGRTARQESSEYGGLGLWGATVGRMKYAVAGLVLAATAGVGALGRFSLSATSRLEQVEVGFKTLLGSQGAATKMINQLQDFAAVTPFQLTDLEKQTQMLLGFGMSAKAVIPSLTAMGDAVSAFGASSADLDSIIIAMGQIATKGHLSYDELRQLNEHKINAAQYLKDSLGVNGSQLQKMIEGKQIGSAQAIPIILGGMEKQFGGAMTAQSKTLAGIWSNIIDRATRAITDRVSPFLPMFKAWLTDLYDHIPEIADSIAGAISKAITMGKKAWNLGSGITGAIAGANGPGGFKDLGKSAGSTIPSVTGRILDTVTGQAAKTDSFGRGAEAGKNSIGFVFGFLQGLFNVGAWWAVIKKHWLAMIGVVVSLFPVGKALGMLGGIFSKLPILKVLAPIFEKAGAAMVKVGGPVWRFIGKIGKAIWESFGRVFPELAGRLEYRVLRLGEIFGRTEHGIFMKVKRWAGRLVNTIVTNVLDSAWKAVGKLATSFYGLIIVPLTGLIPQVREWAKNLWSALPEEFEKAMKRVTGWWHDHFKLPGPGDLSFHLGSILPGMATGGTVTNAGAAMVGERGPEILNLPRGASVVPLPRLAAAGAGGPIPPVEVTLMLDGEVLMRKVLRRQDTALARL